MRLPYGVDAAEFSNLKAWALHPVNGVRLLLHAASIASRSLLSRICPRQTWCPRAVKRKIRRIGRAASIAAQRVAPGSRPEGPSRIRLASGYLEYVDYPNWCATFEDDEQYVSLHRWNWLLRAMSDEKNPVRLEWGVAMMRSWLETMSALPKGLASESYTVGERISNALLFGRLAGASWFALPKDVQQALAEMASRLAQCIEYHGPKATGNHPLNNARALYLAGQCLGLPALADLARVVIAERLSQIVTVDGFMREGSSHYHFLFTRWLLELQLAAIEFVDDDLLDLLREPSRSATARCQFFLLPSADGTWTMPTIGDVSPDCEPEWLLDLPWSSLAASGALRFSPPPRVLKGWASLWQVTGAMGATVATAPADREGLEAYPLTGWYRLDWKGWTAMWRAEPGGAPEQASHAHQDFASLVLYKDGQEVLIDVGRSSYLRTSKSGNHAVSFAAHNAPLVDGLGLMLTQRDRFLPQPYRSGAVEVTSRQDGKVLVVEILHDGYRRKAGLPLKHYRSISVAADSVLISDAFAGTGEVRVELQLQWPTMPNAAESAFVITRESIGILDEQEEFLHAEADGISGWRFPAYGTKTPSVTQRWRANASLPAAIHHRIRMKE